uniref:Uncharacterized protein n=1 Tax=Peronospora matthiolae TaxID=2874970 RepID=A0AAV1UQ50_9STRA
MPVGPRLSGCAIHRLGAGDLVDVTASMLCLYGRERGVVEPIGSGESDAIRPIKWRDDQPVKHRKHKRSNRCRLNLVQLLRLWLSTATFAVRPSRSEFERMDCPNSWVA